ncbi:MAG TPA: adenylyl-sulfate kinase [Polyangiaceae bacterium]|jgi:adenylyl-sulfate kinase|nr:adenylyl-sulfate kinase [Polyangiaceae bacterium]
MKGNAAAASRRAPPETRTGERREGLTIWLTGLPCAGKSTIAAALAPRLRQLGQRVELLDGDVVRTHLSRGLGFSREDRDTNVLRIAFVADLLARNGVTVIVAAVSPYAATREQARQQIGRFIEVYVECPVDECERRDVKGMYRRARAGQMRFFTGVDDPYEAPERPEVIVRTNHDDVAASVQAILAAVQSYKRSR